MRGEAERGGADFNFAPPPFYAPAYPDVNIFLILMKVDFALAILIFSSGSILPSWFKLYTNSINMGFEKKMF